MNTHIAIFASGSGTNAENIIQYFSKSKSIEVSLVVSNRSDAYVLERARLLKVPELIITKKEFSESEYYVLTKLRDRFYRFGRFFIADPEVFDSGISRCNYKYPSCVVTSFRWEGYVWRSCS